MKGTLAGCVLSVFLGWLAWVVLALYLINLGGLRESGAVASVMGSEGMMLKLLPVSFVIVLGAIMLCARYFKVSALSASLGVSAVTAASITPPLAFFPSVHGNYIALLAAGAAGVVVLRAMEVFRQKRVGADGPSNDPAETGSGL